MSRPILALVALALAGCGGAIASDGSVQGKALDAQDGFAAALASGDGLDHITAVYLSSRGDFCLHAQATANVNGTQVLALELALLAPNGSLVAPDSPGTYAIPAPSATIQPGARLAAASFLAVDACGAVQPIAASGGSVHLEHADGPALSGTFDLTFTGEASAPGGHLRGRFSVGACAGGVLAIRNICH